ncbi:MAG: hypothetical protein E6J45_07880 [Chloroflexi bacterium]|nr:MAG: hypothetical protein E6J45_07880 [Chloroflexota bacterium]
MSTAARTSGRGRRTGLRHARWVITLPGAVAAATLLSVVAVYAFFAYTDSSNAHTAAAQGGSVGAGQTPGGFSTSGRDVTFSWSSASNALSYTVARSNVSPGSLSTTLHGSCAGSISATTCTDGGLPENGLAATTWTYADTPSRYNWQGAASSASAQVSIPGPTLSLAATSFTTAGGSTNATVANFFDSEGVTYCIDSSATPCGANQLTTDTVPASGGSKVTTITIPAGEPAGPHTVYAIGASGSAPSGVAITVTGGTPAKVVFTTQPGGGPNGAAWSQQPVVAVEDSGGTVVTTDSSTVTLAINTQPGSGATLSCTGGLSKAASSGLASFSGCQIVGTAGTYTIRATDGSLTPATSASFTVSVGAAAQLTFTQRNIETADTSTVTLAIGTNPSSGTLSGCSETATGGVATFSGCKIDKAGNGYTLTATDATDGLTTPSAPSSAFNITVGAAAKLAFAQQPSNTHTASTITPAVTVQIQDAGGNLTSSTASVTVAIGTNPNGGTLSGTKTVSASGGIASFSTLSINNAGTGYTLNATSGALSGATSSAFTIFGDATQLAFITQPSNSTGGVAFTTQPQVAYEDSGGNIVGSESRTVALSFQNNPSGGTLSGTTSLAATNGIASFSSLSINKAGSGYTLQAACCSLTKGISSAFNITVGPAAQLAFSQQPSNATAGVAISPAVTVEIQDAGGNLTSSTASVSVAIGTNPGGGTLSGTTTVAASGGVATFSNLSINKSGNGYTLTASSSGLTGATSGTFNITAAAATKLAYLLQPSGSTGGIAFGTQPKVAVEDQFGNIVTSNSSSVTLAITSGTGTPGATLTCTTNPLAASSGVATFAGCKIDKAGTGYTLTATDGALTSVISLAIDITVGPASKLVYSQQPTSATAGVSISPAVTVQIQDAGGNLTASAASVTAAIGTNPGGGTLSGTTTVAASSGVATFSDLSINKSGNGYTLAASSGGLTGATSSAFNITPGAATKLAFTNQPAANASIQATGTASFPASVAVEDANGNVKTADNATTVTLAINNNPGGGVLTCTNAGGTGPVTVSSGVASFTGCAITKSGTGYTLTASSTPAYTAPTNANSFNITAGTATKVVFTTQPGGGANGVAWATQPVVTIEDSNGNPVTTNSSTVTLAINTQPGTGATLSCTGGLSKVAASGVASFAGCQIVGTAGSYTLRATDGSLTSATSSAFNITVGAAAKLAFSQQPTSTTAGAAISPAVTVQIQDSGGNLTASTASVTIAIGTNAGGGTLSGTLTVAASGGVATFSDLSINKSGTGYTLAATSSGLTGATSGAFNISAAAATQLVFTSQPASGANIQATGTGTFSASVAVEDTNGNVETADNATTVTMVINNNPSAGVLTCSNSGGLGPVTVSSGVASFTGCAITRSGTGYTLTASSSPPHTAPSNANSFNITPGTATKLVFTNQPAAGASIQATGTGSFAASVAVEDTNGNVETADNATTVTLAIGTNPGSGVLTCANAGGTGPVAVSSGVAGFTGCAISKTGTGYTLTASSSPSRTAPSNANSFNITPGTATKLVLTSQPASGANIQATGTGSFAASVAVADTNGNVETADSTTTVTLAIGTNPGGGALTCSGAGGVGPVTVSGGVASFSGCAITKSGTGYTLTASSNPPYTAPSNANSFNITAGTAAALTFSAQPGSSTEGVALSTQPQLTLTDVNANPVSGTSVSLAITGGTGAAGATLTCTTNPVSTGSNGIAAFAGCKIDKSSGIAYSLTATAGSLTATSSTFTIAAAVVTGLTSSNADGIPAQGDVITVTFSGPVRPSSICSAWGSSGAASTSTISTNVTLAKPTSGNNTLTVSDPACTFNVFSGGSLNLGTTGYVVGTAPATAVFGNTTKCTGSSHCSAVAIDATDTVLTITLGDAESGSVTSAAISNPGVTYSPNSAIVGADGVTVTGSATDSASRFF